MDEQVNLRDVVRLAEELTDEQKAVLSVWLLDRIKTRDFMANERLDVFD